MPGRLQSNPTDWRLFILSLSMDARLSCQWVCRLTMSGVGTDFAIVLAPAGKGQDWPLCGNDSMTAVYTDDPHQVVHCADCLELVTEDPQDDNDYLGRCLHCRREIIAQGGVHWRRAVPEREYTSVSAGVYHACGIRIDQTVACWGSNLGFDGDFLGQATPPDGPFKVINAGTFHTCGFRPDGEIRCWGSIVRGMDGEVTTCEQQPDGTSRSGQTKRRPRPSERGEAGRTARLTATSKP